MVSGTTFKRILKISKTRIRVKDSKQYNCFYLYEDGFRIWANIKIVKTYMKRKANNTEGTSQELKFSKLEDINCESHWQKKIDYIKPGKNMSKREGENHLKVPRLLDFANRIVRILSWKDFLILFIFPTFSVFFISCNILNFLSSFYMKNVCITV